MVDAVILKLPASVEAPLPVDGHALSMSASIGGDTVRGFGDSYEALVTLADAAMCVRRASAR